uniref:Neurotransmitter-gated ion-channel transmembrane domain-containing protein n=1 Tax=Plectus sambesii TaxID=2011161 RepID=A0A914WKX0_9BILA
MAVPARVSLSFTTLLTLATQGTGIRYSLPPVSYAKAIDYWYGTCMLFLFAALLEFAVVNSYMRKSQKFDVLCNPNSNKAHAEDGALGYQTRASISKYPQVKTAKTIVEKVFAYRSLCLEFAQKATRIDQLSRILFPLVFIVFNVTYWLYYKFFAAE